MDEERNDLELSRAHLFPKRKRAGAWKLFGSAGTGLVVRLDRAGEYKSLLNLVQPRIIHFSCSDCFTQSRLSAHIP